MKYRIIKKNNNYYPQRYAPFIFGLFHVWMYYDDVVMDITGECSTYNKSFNTLDKAKEYIIDRKKDRKKRIEYAPEVVYETEDGEEDKIKKKI